MPGEPRESTLARWHQEGLLEGKDYYEALTELLGIHDKKVPHQEIELGVSFKMIPQFEEKVIEHREGHFIVQDWMGALVEISDQYDFTYLRFPKDFVTRKWHKFPVETEADWEEMKGRYNPNSPGRFPSDFHEKCQSLKDRDDIVRVSFNGPFWQLREWCGLENLCLLLIDKPDFVKEMADFWRDFVLQTLIPILKRTDIDHFHISEDMAYKGHSMISPAMVREFLFPCYLTWIPEIKKSNSFTVIEMDSDGYIGELIPLWIEAGFNCCSPVEVAAGNDIVEYRSIYGKKMAYRGGIDKRAIAEGGKTMEEEVLRIVPPLLKEGGFIPSCDHGVPPDVSWQNYVDYSRMLANLTGWL
jgi:uroporphyrinogen decarboxylase